MRLLNLSIINLAVSVALALANPARASESAEYVVVSPTRDELRIDAETKASHYATAAMVKVAKYFKSPYQCDYSFIPIDSHYADLLYNSQEEWLEHLREPHVVVEIEIRPNGFLNSTKVVRNSGDDSFDAAVREAVMQAAPFGHAKIATKVALTVYPPELTEVQAGIVGAKTRTPAPR